MLHISGYFFSALAFELFSITVSVVFFNVIFQNTTSLGGWNIYQCLFLYFFSKFIILLDGALVRNGLKVLSQDLVRWGDFDFYVTKPVNSMFLVSFAQPRPVKLIASVVYGGVAVYCLLHTGVPIIGVSVFWFSFLAICGLVLFYSLEVLAAIPSFWLVRVWALQDLNSRMSEFMRYPAAIFSIPFQVILFLVYPILAASYIPVTTLFYPPKPLYIIYMLLITLTFGFAVRLLWRLGEKNYSSASS
jgi:ABC-2 type transport system permease protein